MEKRSFDLTPLAKVWVVEQFLAFVADEPERVENFTFDVRGLGDYFAEYVNDYLVRHEIAAPNDKTATALCYSRSQIYRKFKK